ncbi:MAG: translation elongation factor Ts [Armatimonadaceae bacterium]
MAEITAAAIAKLREQTGAGMMQCKQALVEANGDMEEAKVILRKKLGDKAAKRGAERTAAEGLVLAKIGESRTTGAMLELNCESDFVAKNDDFKNLGRTLLAKLMSFEAGSAPADREAFLAADHEGKTVEAYINEAAGPIGEKVALGRFVRFDAPEGNTVALYVHNPGGSGEEGGKIGALVELTGADSAALSTLGKDVAQHITAANPQYLTEGDVEEAILDKEREIARDQAANDPKMAGKPEKAIEAMVNGRVRKFLEETVLLKQAYVRDPAKSIEAVVSDVPGATLVRFVRFRVGETALDQPEADEA